MKLGGKRVSRWGRQQATLRSEVFQLYIWMCTGTAEREGGGGMKENRKEREGRMENECTALGVLKEFHGTAKSFAFSELILDYHLPYRRLPEGL